MNQSQARYLLGTLLDVEDGCENPSDVRECLKIMREEIEYLEKTVCMAAPQAPAEPISDAEIMELWRSVPDDGDEIVTFARALLERTK